jgi:Nicotianamine synthase protein
LAIAARVHRATGDAVRESLNKSKFGWIYPGTLAATLGLSVSMVLTRTFLIVTLRNHGRHSPMTTINPHLTPVNWGHARRIKQQEHETAAALLKQLQGACARDLGLTQMDDFFRDTYLRVQDMFALPDFHRCRQLVMVGSGPLPTTLMHIAKSHPQIDLLGLDIDAEAVQVGRKLVALFGLGRIRLAESDGLHHDYGDVQIVYVANLVSPKALILQRIAQTAASGTLVVLRDPTASGADQAEAGIEALDPRLHLEGTGPESLRFQSRHVFLRVQTVAPTQR